MPNAAASNTAVLNILRAKQVAERLNVSVSTVWSKTNPKDRRHDAAFPKPFKVSGNVTGWLESEVNAYSANLAAARGRKETA